jgi:hypothetical protein
MFGHIAVIYPPARLGEGIEIFNNVFDGGGWMNVPAVEVAPGAFVKSLRNNVFCNFAHKGRYYKGPQGMIRAAWATAGVRGLQPLPQPEGGGAA